MVGQNKTSTRGQCPTPLPQTVCNRVAVPVGVPVAVLVRHDFVHLPNWEGTARDGEPDMEHAGQLAVLYVVVVGRIGDEKIDLAITQELPGAAAHRDKHTVMVL